MSFTVFGAGVDCAFDAATGLVWSAWRTGSGSAAPNGSSTPLASGTYALVYDATTLALVDAIRIGDNRSDGMSILIRGRLVFLGVEGMGPLYNSTPIVTSIDADTRAIVGQGYLGVVSAVENYSLLSQDAHNLYCSVSNGATAGVTRVIDETAPFARGASEPMSNWVYHAAWNPRTDMRGYAGYANAIDLVGPSRATATAEGVVRWQFARIDNAAETPAPMRWPASLPQPTGATLKPAERRLLSSIPTGPMAARAMQRDRLAVQDLEFVFRTDHLAAWQAFLARLQRCGAWFEARWPHPTGQAQAYRFIGEPSHPEYLKGGWRVQASVEVRGSGVTPQDYWAVEAFAVIENSSPGVYLVHSVTGEVRNIDAGFHPKAMYADAPANRLYVQGNTTGLSTEPHVVRVYDTGAQTLVRTITGHSPASTGINWYGRAARLGPASFVCCESTSAPSSQMWRIDFPPA